MSKLHKNLTPEKWSKLSKKDQILNIAAELSRATHWLEKDVFESAKDCYERALELVDLTLDDNRWKGNRRELAHFREVLASFYIRKTSPSMCDFFYDWLIGFSQIS